MARVRVAACQINTVVGDLEGTARRILGALDEAERGRADLAVFPELAVTGYPPEDLLGRPAFVTDNRAVFAEIAASTGTCAAVVGYVDTDRAGRLVNAAAMCAGGRVVGRYFKRLLPNYGVFDEQRWFAPGDGPSTRPVVAGVPLGMDPDGALSASARQFEEEVLLVDLDVDVPPPAVAPALPDGVAAGTVVISGTSRAEGSHPVADTVAPVLDPEAEVYGALVLGTRDYVAKNGFTDAVIGLSGGIDSSLVAAIAVDALGAAHVHGVTMPSRYSSEGSVADAVTLAANLGIDIANVSIEGVHRAFSDALSPLIGAAPSGLTDENLQSRLRGVLLMALSNAMSR